MDLSFLIERKKEGGLLSVELLTLAYMLITTVMIGLHYGNLPSPDTMLGNRVMMLCIMAATNVAYRIYPCRLSVVLRVVPIILGLIIWYPETYDFSSVYANKDHIFATADEVLFGCQPSLEFSRIFSGAFWSEAFCMGYYAYYYMMALMVFFYLLFRYDQFERATFVFLSVFFVYYLIFDFLPVAGPQYYFKAIGIDNALAGHFPEMGHYFQTHLEALRLPSHGIFSDLVAGAQEVGERPTAAFPSSHVGMSTVTMILVWKTRNRWLFWCLMPFFILLCCATVYIKAHYLVDSIAGLITAFIFYYLADWCYSRFSKSMPLLHRAR